MNTQGPVLVLSWMNQTGISGIEANNTINQTVVGGNFNWSSQNITLDRNKSNGTLRASDVMETVVVMALVFTSVW